MVNQHYRWDFIGLSTDSKPTPETSEKVTDGSTFYTSDDSKLYVWYKDQWYEKEDTGGGGGGGGEGVKTLTTDDYNYPTDNPTSVGLWLLEPGLYQADTATVTIMPARGNTWSDYGVAVITVGDKDSSDIASITMYVYGKYNYYMTNTSTGILSTTSVQGLDNIIRNRDIYGNNDNTIIKIGNSSNARGTQSVSIGAYSTAFGYADVAIGSNATTKNTSNYSVAIGQYANADSNGSVAIGFGSHSVAQGEFNIGTNATYAGYDNTNYRLLTGLHDPVNDHDGATKGYVDGLISAIEARLTAGGL